MNLMTRSSTVCTVLLAAASHAQNLVPNPSFEEFTMCPDDQSQIERATGWEANAWSPDYYNVCDVSGHVGVPSNIPGYQFAASGAAYAGMITYTDSTLIQEYNEYIGIYLTQPLIPNVLVYLSFKTSPTIQGNSVAMKYLSKGIGMKFTMHPLDLQNPQPGDNIAALHLDQVLTDTSTWVLVHGSYMPDSAYQYLVIGNFFDPVQSQPELVNPSGTLAGAYSFVDDVCVSYDSTEYQHVGWSESVSTPAFTIAPSPFTNESVVIFSTPCGANASLVIQDQAGRVVSVIVLPVGATSWHIAGDLLATGAYTIALTTSTGASRPVAVMHVSP